ncbi:glycine zipper 2TM domain-containing protein [Azonexus sp.]|jgi:uncharacterized protein YcfJ|uniref:glycine zipper 2TM domain-containing protein n=1 Tax=Azonexus sp. TaxID=1872668 RepID=UPI0035AE5ACB
MDKSMLKGMLIGGVVVTAVTAAGVTGYQQLKQPVFADVLSVKEATETVRTPREECVDVPVQRRAAVRDQHRIAGTAIGAVAGGLLGSAVGQGTGKKLAIVAGAAAGGYAGNKVQQNLQNRDTESSVERRCKTVYDSSEKHLGYDVTYRLDGKQDMVRMAYNPGTRIPVRDGHLVIDEPPKN